MIKIIFFDIDGTLRPFETGIIPESTKLAIKKAQEAGIYCAIATGRHWVEIYNEGLVDGMYFDAFVTLDGGYSYILNEAKAKAHFSINPGKKPPEYQFLMDIPEEELPYFDPKFGEVLLREDIPPVMVEKLLLLLEKEPFPVLFLEERRLYANFVNEDLLRTLAYVHTGVPPLLPLEEAKKNRQLMLIPILKKRQVPLLEESLPDCHLIRWSDGMSFDIAKKGVSKIHGIQKIIERLGISITEVAAIGDGWNDVEMLDSVGLGIAMGNAKPEAKAVANHITEHILEEGLPKAVDFILNLNKE